MLHPSRTRLSQRGADPSRAREEGSGVSLAELLWLVAPPLCWGCADAVRGGGPFCRRCRAELRWLDTTPVEAGGVPAWGPLAHHGPAPPPVGGVEFPGAARLAG